MNEPYEELTYRGHNITISYDPIPANPRLDFDPLGEIVIEKYSSSNRFKLAQHTCEELHEWMVDLVEGPLIAWAKVASDNYDNPLEIRGAGEVVERMLSRSAVVFSMDVWDSGIEYSLIEPGEPTVKKALMYCTLEKAIENWVLPEDSTWDTQLDDWADGKKGQTISLRDATVRVLEGELESLRDYIRGDVYGWEAVDESCWGYYGNEGVKDAIETAKDTIDVHLKSLTEKHTNRLKQWIRHRVPLKYRKKLELN